MGNTATKSTIELSNEKLKEIYTNPEFRNQVAGAHKCLTSTMQFKHFQTCSYPITYIVTQQQIDEAKKEVERAKKQALKNLGNKLVFVGMGCTYEPKYNDDVCNHRIRTEIQNPEGRKFFIEFSLSGRYEKLHFDHVIDRDLEKEYKDKESYYREKIKEKGGFGKVSQDSFLFQELKKYQQQPYYWFKKEVWQNMNEKYTLSNVLKIVNLLFDCAFTEIEIDNYTLSPDDFICQSPKI